MKYSIALCYLFAALVYGIPISHDEFENHASQGLRLLSLGEAEPVWKTEDDKLDLKRQGVRFVGTTCIRAIWTALTSECLV